MTSGLVTSGEAWFATGRDGYWFTSCKMYYPWWLPVRRWYVCEWRLETEEIFIYCRLYHIHWSAWEIMFCVTCWTVTVWTYHDWNIVLTEVICTIKLKLFYWRNRCLKSNMILKPTLDVLCEVLVLFLKKLRCWRESSSSGGFDKVTWYWLVLLWFDLIWFDIF